jgi:hypothetical protein
MSHPAEPPVAETEETTGKTRIVQLEAPKEAPKKPIPSPAQCTVDTLFELCIIRKAVSNGNPRWKCCVCGVEREASTSRLLEHAEKHPQLRHVVNAASAKRRKFTQAEERRKAAAELTAPSRHPHHKRVRDDFQHGAIA